MDGKYILYIQVKCDMNILQISIQNLCFNFQREEGVIFSMLYTDIYSTHYWYSKCSTAKIKCAMTIPK